MASGSTPGYAAGTTVTPYYDPLLAKLCVWGRDRAAALERAREAVAEFQIEGIKTNLPFFAELLAEPGLRLRATTTPGSSRGCAHERDLRSERDGQRVAAARSTARTSATRCRPR